MRPPPPPPAAAVDPEPLQIVAEGVMTLVTVPAPEYARDMEDPDPVQGLLVTSLVTSEESCCRVGDVTVREEPDARVTEKLLALTTMDCNTALEPDTLRVYPPTEMTVLDVSITSL